MILKLIIREANFTRSLRNSNQGGLNAHLFECNKNIFFSEIYISSVGKI